MLTVGTAVDVATGDGPPRTLDRCRNRRCSITHRRAPLPQRGRPFELDADVTQISPMAAAARCSVGGRRLERGTNNAAANLADPVHPKILPEVHERPADEHGRGQRHD
jgi:hypothetical protein